MHNLQVYISYFESDLQELIIIHSLDECLAVAFAIPPVRHNTTSTVYTIFANSRNSRIFTLRYPDFWLP